MKKVLCLLVALLLIGSVGSAEITDLSLMTDDELLALRGAVDSEMLSRDSIGASLSEGVYAVGVSFEQGGYTFVSHKDESDGDYVWIYLGVFNNEADIWDNDKAMTTFCLTEDGKSYHLDLREGQFLHVTTPGGTCTYQKDK